jgi:predicted phosphodiesterase
MTSFEPTLGPCDTEQAEILDQLAASNLRFVMCGHTHRRAVARYGELVVVNAGALTECDRPGFAIVDFDHGHVEFFEFGATASTCAEVAHRMSFCRGS